MSITQKSFGTINNLEVTSFLLDNGKGLSAEILNYGGIIRRLVFNGTDVVLGRDTMEQYAGNPSYFGALIGRNSNRIENAEFELNGKVYKLNVNETKKNNNLHGGIHGFCDKVWTAQAIDDAEPKLVLTAFSPDGEEGFPGNAQIKVTYTLSAENSIKIHYEATSDADTLMNLTNHSYFNLNGHSSGDVKNHTLQLNCGFYTPIDSASNPVGEVLSVTGTPFDFRAPKKIGQDFGCDDAQMSLVDGYDHNYAIDGRGYRKFAIAEGDISHIKMEAYTDLPAVQLYTGNFITPSAACKEGALYSAYQGFCLETQVFPNAMNYSFFPSPILKKGEKYDTVTEYKFTQNK